MHLQKKNASEFNEYIKNGLIGARVKQVNWEYGLNLVPNNKILIQLNNIRNTLKAEQYMGYSQSTTVLANYEHFFANYPILKNEFSNLYSNAVMSFVDWEIIKAQALPPSLLSAVLSVGLIYAYPTYKYFKAKKLLKQSIKTNGNVKTFNE